LYARWVEKDIPVTFDANGGTGGGEVMYAEGDKIGTFPSVSYSGFILNGWYTEANGGNKVSESTVIQEGDVFYAHWEKDVPAAGCYDANGNLVIPWSTLVDWGLNVSKTYNKNTYGNGGFYGVAYDHPSSFTNVTTLVLPDTVTYIGGYAFCAAKSSYAPELTKIIVPSSVTSIGAYAFATVNNIKSSSTLSVYFEHTTPPTFGNYCLPSDPGAYGTYGKTTIYFKNKTVHNAFNSSTHHSNTVVSTNYSWDSRDLVGQ